MIGIYRPGTTVLHRAPPWVKLALLSLGMTGMLVWSTPAAVGVGAVVVVTGYLAAGIGPGTLLAQVWPLRWIVLLLSVFQWWTRGPWPAFIAVGGLLVAVAAAALVTLTTRTEDLIEVITTLLRPLRRVGVNPDRVALAFALAIRAIPVLTQVLREVTQARRARGLERSLRALLVPVLVRTVRHATATGEALAARGLDDDLS